MPVPVPIQPWTNQKTVSERNHARCNGRSREGGGKTPDGVRVIYWYINNLCLCRNDLDNVILYYDHLLGCGLENVVVQRCHAKALNRLCNSWFLHNVGLSQRRRPFRMLSHHVEDLWIVSGRFNADIPILILDKTLIHPAAQQLLGL